MITTVTLNAAIDRTYYMDRFSINKVNRTKRIISEPGGKGINVSKILKILNINTVSTGFLGGLNGQLIKRLADEKGLHSDFAMIEGESRICLNIIDEYTNQTEILELGPTILEREWIGFKRKLLELANKSTYVILSGSLPKGLLTTAYQELIELVQQNGTRAIVDTSGQPLKEALKAKPFMIKPNIDELSEITNRPLQTDDEIMNALIELSHTGVSVVAVSRGSDGAMAAYDNCIYTISIPKLSVVNPVGSGDAFVAGLVSGFYDGESFEKSLIRASAAGTANALQEKAGDLSLEDLKSLEKQMSVNQFSFTK